MGIKSKITSGFRWLLSHTFAAVLGAIAGIVVPVWVNQAQADPMPLASALMFSLVVGSAVLVGWNQLQQIVARNDQHQLATRSPSDIRSQLIDWIRSLGFSYTERPSVEGVDFAVVVHRTGDPDLAIASLTGKPWLDIVTAGQITDEMHTELSPGGMALFEFETRKALLQLGTQYASHYDEATGCLTRIDILTQLVMRGETDPLDFLKAMWLVDRGFKAVFNQYQVLNLWKHVSPAAKSLQTMPSSPMAQSDPAPPQPPRTDP